MDKQFLITYENSGIYRFFSEDKGAYTLSLSTFGERIIPEITQTEVDNFYMREITDTNLKEEVIELETQGSSVITFDAENYVIDITDDSFAMSNGEVVPSSFSAVGGRAQITLEEEVPEIIRVQLAYYSSFALVESEEYQLIIKNEEIPEGEQFVITCQFKNDVLYIGNYDYFMGEDEDTPSADTIVFNENPKLIDEYISINKNQYKVTFGETGGTGAEYNLYTKIISELQPDAYIGNRYLYDSGEDTEEPFFIITKEIEWFSYVLNEELTDEEVYYHIIGENLVSEPNRIDLPKYYRKWYEEDSQIITVDYCISCIDDESLVSGQDYYTLNMSGPEAKSTTAKNYLENLSDKTWLYLSEPVTDPPKEYNLLIEPYNIILIPELTGAALVSFGKKEEETIYTLTEDTAVDEDKTYYEKQGEEYVEVTPDQSDNPKEKGWYESTEIIILKNNYGIGINSSDSDLDLPQKAISLFEAEVSSDEDKKINLNYRGILGTLPSQIVMNNEIKSNMVGTQGIYTDNMYIGDESQYVAFYTDKNDGNAKKLKIRASEIDFETNGQYANLSNHLSYYNGVLSLKTDRTAARLDLTSEGMEIIGVGGTPLAKYGANAIIGDENNFHIKISGTELGFYERTTKISSIQKDTFFIDKTAVFEEVGLGYLQGQTNPSTGVEGKGLWAWRTHVVNGQNNLCLKWLG